MRLGVRRVHLLRAYGAVLLWAGSQCVSNAIFWNNDPALGVTSAAGLPDRVDWFQNVHVIRNQSNNTQGTTMLLDAEWAITVRHVVQHGGNYSQVTSPENVYVDVFGTRYYADRIFTPDGGSEIALVRLRGGVQGALDARDSIHSGDDDHGRVAHIGGYGYRGYFDAGGTLGLGAFRRAYNIGFIAPNGQIRIVADGESLLANHGLLEGTVGSGDSGGPMFAYFGRLDEILQAGLDDWRLVGLTATGTGGSGGESWGGSSNFTRVRNYAGWIDSTLNSIAPPGPSTTGPWIQHAGSGLYDTGGDKFSVTGSNAGSAIQANFGPGGAGFTLDSFGDRLTMNAIFDTTLPIGNLQLRYGMFDDGGGTLAGNVAGGTPWNGYFVGNATENAAQGAYEKGPYGGGVGQWWSLVAPNSAVLAARATVATGTYDDPAGDQVTPPGRYALTLEFTRVAEGLQIDWSTVSVDSGNQPTGLYSHSGSFTDLTPASDTWTYNKLGFLVSGSAFVGTMIVDDIRVAFFDATLPGDYNHDGRVDAGDYVAWRNTLGSEDTLDADGDKSGAVDLNDYIVWKNAYGTSYLSGAGPLNQPIPEPSVTVWIVCLSGAGILIRRVPSRGRLA